MVLVSGIFPCYLASSGVFSTVWICHFSSLKPLKTLSLASMCVWSILHLHGGTAKWAWMISNCSMLHLCPRFISRFRSFVQAGAHICKWCQSQFCQPFGAGKLATGFFVPYKVECPFYIMPYHHFSGMLPLGETLSALQLLLYPPVYRVLLLSNQFIVVWALKKK